MSSGMNPNLPNCTEKTTNADKNKTHFRNLPMSWQRNGKRVNNFAKALLRRANNPKLPQNAIYAKNMAVQATHIGVQATHTMLSAPYLGYTTCRLTVWSS